LPITSGTSRIAPFTPTRWAAARPTNTTSAATSWPSSTRWESPIAEFALEHGYDELGNRISTTLPSGRRVNWLRYGSGHLHQINIASRRHDGSWAYRIVSDIERDALHREVQRSQGAVASRYEHDPMGRLLTQRVARSQTLAGERTVPGLRQDRHAISGLTRQYRYDAAGNLQSTQDSLRGQARYAYDRLGRVLSGIKAGQAEHFAFDPAGNLLQQAGTAVPDNRVHVFQDLRLEYDEHGNVTRRLKGWHTEQQFSYGPEHQLHQAVVRRSTERNDRSAVVSQTTRYRYDALGRRVDKTDAFGSTQFAYDGDLLALEQRGGKRAEYLYEDASFVPLARIESTAQAEDYALQYYHCDQIGAPQELSDEHGRIVWAADYKVWGEVRAVQALATGTDGRAAGERTLLRSVAASGEGGQDSLLGSVEQPLRFQGQYFDAETGLHYNRFRYYDPVVGRFTTNDPIGLYGSLNLFTYSPNPLGWSDPRGLTGNPAAATHITYQGVKDGKPYVGYASMPGCQDPRDVLRYRYSGNFDIFDGGQPKILYAGYGQAGKDVARGLEQITYKNLGITSNKQNPVGLRNKRRGIYLAAAAAHCPCGSVKRPDC
jgi:RHS repeat-associated protein